MRSLRRMHRFRQGECIGFVKANATAEMHSAGRLLTISLSISPYNYSSSVTAASCAKTKHGASVLEHNATVLAQSAHKREKGNKMRGKEGQERRTHHG